jgi:hypothetical protein
LLLIAVQSESQRHLFVGDIERGTLLQVTHDAVTDYGWSSDGRRVDYRKTNGTLWSRPADLSVAETLLTDRKDLPGTDAGLVSRDGRWRVMSGESPASKTGSDIWLLDELSRIGPLRPWVQNTPNDAALAFSPDGSWLLYATQNPIGSPPNRNELYVQPFPGPGRVLPITPDGARTPYRWLRQEIVYRQLGGGTQTVLMSARVTTNGTSLTVEVPQQLMDIQSSYRWTDATRDGQRFLFRKDTSATSEGNPATELHVIVNWIEDVKQKIAAAKVAK